MSDDFEKIKNAALRLIKFRMRSCFELKSKLKNKGFTEKNIKNVIEFLENIGYIDDYKFAKAWVNSRLQFKPRSKFMLNRELKNKGVAEHIIDDVLAPLNSDYEEDLAKNLIIKRMNALRNIDLKAKKRRLANYLSRRGFTASIVIKLINEFVKK